MDKPIYSVKTVSFRNLLVYHIADNLWWNYGFKSFDDFCKKVRNENVDHYLLLCHECGDVEEVNDFTALAMDANDNVLYRYNNCKELTDSILKGVSK